MILNFLGTELDNNVEHELFSETEFGFDVTVSYSKDSWMSKHEGKQVFSVLNNCTEVHYLYESIFDDKAKIAFESDIQGTGCNRSVEDIESVYIKIADSLSHSFHEKKDYLI